MENVLQKMERIDGKRKIADFTDELTGERYGWARVLDYIGIGY